MGLTDGHMEPPHSRSTRSPDGYGVMATGNHYGTSDEKGPSKSISRLLLPSSVLDVGLEGEDL
jgi:hypothetical protein